MPDDRDVRATPASMPDVDRANERDQRLAELTARLRADNQRFSERGNAAEKRTADAGHANADFANADFVNAELADSELSSPDEDRAQKRRSRFWDLVLMLRNREQPGSTERVVARAPALASPRADAVSAVERAALSAIAEALATPDISRDLAALQSLAQPDPYEPTRRASRPLPVIEGSPVAAGVAAFDDASDADEGSDADWQEIKAEALRLLQADLLDTPSSHLSYIQKRIKPVFDHDAIES